MPPSRFQAPAIPQEVLREEATVGVAIIHVDRGILTGGVVEEEAPKPAGIFPHHHRDNIKVCIMITWPALPIRTPESREKKPKVRLCRPILLYSKNSGQSAGKESKAQRSIDSTGPAGDKDVCDITNFPTLLVFPTL
jgi:hypothetical protein